MISTFLVENPWLTGVGLLVVVVVGPVLGVVLWRRRRLTWTLMALAAVAVLAITMYPERRTPEPGCQVAWALPTLGAVELMANVLLFVPPVLLGAIASRRPVLAFLAGVVLSGLIEALQAAAPVFGRSCDTTDLLSNAIGAGLGALLAGGVLVVMRRREHAPARGGEAATRHTISR